MKKKPTKHPEGWSSYRPLLLSHEYGTILICFNDEDTYLRFDLREYGTRVGGLAISEIKELLKILNWHLGTHPSSTPGSTSKKVTTTTFNNFIQGQTVRIDSLGKHDSPNYTLAYRWDVERFLSMNFIKPHHYSNQDKGDKS